MALFRLLGETARDAWRPTPVMDGVAQDYRDQIVRHLHARGMPTHAALFAKANRLQDRLQWYTDVEGQVESLDSIRADRQQPFIDGVVWLLEDVRREGLRLGTERDPRLRSLGDLLSAALDGTDALRVSDVHVVNGQPVIAWGLRPVADALSMTGLFGLGTAPLRPSQPRHTAAPVAAAEIHPLAAPAPSIPESLQTLESLDAPPHGLGEPPRPAAIEWLVQRGYLIARRPLELLGLAALLALAALPFVWWFSRPPPVRPLTVQDLRRPAPPPASASASPIEVWLGWAGPANLDLHVHCPDGTHISRLSPVACDGARDARSSTPAEGLLSTETVSWPHGAKAGTYIISVEYVGGMAQSPPVPVVLRIIQDGRAQDFHQDVHGFLPVRINETVGAFVVR